MSLLDAILLAGGGFVAFIAVQLLAAYIGARLDARDIQRIIDGKD